ncbi:hypothetical protein AJ78_06547 [Emergomyces pasteurianus Ep9510]|uniref:Protein kinase domain-containing protein n=1 Tax=Emergomyces pasteurianus Ep9510 TaxID=1447872 RepID=A0A1J9PYG7_9EURO|nr:hypothetical protein AJ78_06547 [Emergomyces pasteurianus Ep9510]
MPITNGAPVLCDFGQPEFGVRKFRGNVMSDFYRAPKVILGMERDCKIDIVDWSHGAKSAPAHNHGRYGIYLKVVRLLYALKNRILDDEQHLAGMVALMGPPARSFLDRSEKSRKYWDAEEPYPLSVPSKRK